MKIILYKDVPNLGEEGDIKVVAEGYARNYLLPKKFAVKYTRMTETELAQKRRAIGRRKAEKAEAASGDKTRIESLEMDVAVAAGEKGKLFGSITTTAIVDFLNSCGVNVERKRVELPEGGIKTLGDHLVQINLYGGESATLKVKVNPSTEKNGVNEAPAERKIEAIHDEDEAGDDIDYLNQIAAQDLVSNPVSRADGESEKEDKDNIKDENRG